MKMASTLLGSCKEKWIRSFTVTDPTKHEKGFTVYKVTYRAFCLSMPDDVIEVTVWKRYNDFKKLHKALSTLHFHLRRPEKFPEFAKTTFFGRFADQVIEERRQSALRLLEFTATISPLSSNTYFKQFFEGGEEITKKLPAQRVPILQPQIVTSLESTAGDKVSTITEERGEVKAREDDKKLSGTRNGFTPPLGGIWLHRQVEDEAIDYGDMGQLDEDDDDDRTTFSEDSVPSTPLPQLQDMSLFDPMSTDMPATSESGTLPHSNSWLFHAMDMCAELHHDGTESPQEGGTSATEISTDSGITINFSAATSQTTPSDVSVSDSTISSPSVSNLATPTTPGLPSPDISCHAPPGSKPQRSSMARAYLNSIRAQQLASVDSADGVFAGRAGSNSPEKRPRTSSTYSAADLEIGGVEDYLYQAARHISMALDNEANGNYQSSFDLYKEGVGILLKGVIDDNNKTRREAVRRKTAQYLMKAEDLYNKYLSAEAANARRWESQKMIVEFDFASAHLKGPAEDLKNYKVLGIIDRVLLVLDIVSYQTYAIKVLRKCPVANKKRPTVIPADCPYMVKLYRYFETDCSIFLVLEHATGGKLWSYASVYLHHDLNNTVPFVCSLERSIGSRTSRKSRTSSSIGGMEERVRRISGEDSVFVDDLTITKQLPGTASSCSSSGRMENVDNDVKRKLDRNNLLIPDVSRTLQPNDKSGSGDECGILQTVCTSTTHTEIGKDITEMHSATPPMLSESSEVASSYANMFSNYTKKTQSPCSSSDDFMNIEDEEETGSNLNDLVQASSQYGESSSPTFNNSVFSAVDDLSRHNKSFNTTVQQVNTKPPPMTLFSIDSSDSPDVQSTDSLDHPSFPFACDNADIDGSLEGLGQLKNDTKNGTGATSVATNESGGVWPSHDSDSVMTGAIKVMEKLEQDTYIHSKSMDSSTADGDIHIPPDTSGFGAVFEDRIVSTPGMDLAEFFDNVNHIDRLRAVTEGTPPYSSQDNVFFANQNYGPPKRSFSLGNDHDKPTSTTSQFMGLRLSTSLSFGKKGYFGSSKPKSSLEDLLEPSDTNEISSEWEIGIETSVENNDVSQRTDCSKSKHDENALLLHCISSNGATTLIGEPTLNLSVNCQVPSVSTGQNKNSTSRDEQTIPSKHLTETGESSENGSLESSTTARELPSSIYSSTQSTPKHSEAIVKMADWPGDVLQTEIPVQLESTKQYEISGDAPSALEKPDGKQTKKSDFKSKLSKPRLPSLATFLTQMDETTTRHATLTTLPESCVRMWVAEIVVAVASLHSVGIICKDLRPHNILLAEGGHIRLTYFSQWKYVEPEINSYACEHFYTAPEVTAVYDVTDACDWWSLGAILYELLTSKSLYSCHPSGINSHTQLNIPDHISAEAKRLMEQVNPLERLGCGASGVDDIKVHPFFNGINWSLYKG